MALQGSGAISINNINVELGKAGTTTSSLGQADFRTLAGVPSGAISMSNFYGKSNIIYDTTNRYAAYYGGGYPVGLDITTGVDITIKNPTIRIWGYCSNGEGETSDRRVMYCYGKRTDGTWDTLSYSAHENDVTHGSDTFDYSFTVSNGYWYNQFRYTLAGMGQNWYQMDCYVDACYHQ